MTAVLKDLLEIISLKWRDPEFSLVAHFIKKEVVHLIINILQQRPVKLKVMLVRGTKMGDLSNYSWKNSKN